MKRTICQTSTITAINQRRTFSICTDLIDQTARRDKRKKYSFLLFSFYLCHPSLDEIVIRQSWADGPRQQLPVDFPPDINFDQDIKLSIHQSTVSNWFESGVSEKKNPSNWGWTKFVIWSLGLIFYIGPMYIAIDLVYSIMTRYKSNFVISNHRFCR